MRNSIYTVFLISNMALKKIPEQNMSYIRDCHENTFPYDLIAPLMKLRYNGIHEANIINNSQENFYTAFLSYHASFLIDFFF